MESKLWFIIIEDKECGPFSKVEVEGMDGLTPETLVKKLTWESYKRLIDVDELKISFEEDKLGNKDNIKRDTDIFKDKIDEREVMTMDFDPRPLLGLLLLIIILLIFYFYRGVAK